jgi:hypothetical protein
MKMPKNEDTEKPISDVATGIIQKNLSAGISLRSVNFHDKNASVWKGFSRLNGSPLILVE